MTRCRVRVCEAGVYTLLLRRAVRLAVKNERLCYPCAADLLLVGDTDIRRVNKARRGEDKVTDVLSFPAWSAGERPAPDPGTGRVFIGDILIAEGRAREQAARYGHRTERELCYLAAHGALHLLGYSHDTEWERAVMRRKEEDVMERMGLTR
jgi:probable rRNA maturation factor